MASGEPLPETMMTQFIVENASPGLELFQHQNVHVPPCTWYAPRHPARSSLPLCQAIIKHSTGVQKRNGRPRETHDVIKT